MRRIYYLIITCVLLIIINTSLFFFINSSIHNKNSVQIDNQLFTFLYTNLPSLTVDIKEYHYNYYDEVYNNKEMDSLYYIREVDKINKYVDNCSIVIEIYSYILDPDITFTINSYDYNSNPTFNEIRSINLEPVSINYWFKSKHEYEKHDYTKQRFEDQIKDYYDVYHNKLDTIINSNDGYGYTKTVFVTDSIYKNGKYHYYVLGIDFLHEHSELNDTRTTMLMIVINSCLFFIIFFLIYRNAKDYLKFIKFLGNYIKNGFIIEDFSPDSVNIKELHNNILLLDREYKNVLNKHIEINKILESFAYITAHDLKTPVRSIGVFVGRVLRKIKQDNIDIDSIDKDLIIIKSHVTRMDNLIDNIIVYSRMGKSRKKTSVVEIDRLIQNHIVKYVSLDDVVFNIKADRLKVNINRSLFKVVLDNLITNSIKYGDKEKTNIIIKFYEKNDSVIFSIEDNGKGIKDDYINRIFDAFDKLDADGTGLGLSIVKRFFDQYNAEYKVESIVGKFTKFTIEINKDEILVKE